MTATASTLFDLTDAALRPLFDYPTARATDPITSHEAAASARPRAGTLRADALVALAAAGTAGLTDFELATKVSQLSGRPVGQTSIGVRRKELTTAGYVTATDRRRPSTTGTPAIVWQITDRGALEAHRLAHESRDRR